MRAAGTVRPGEVGLWRSSLVMNIVMRLSRARSVTMHNIYADIHTDIYTNIYTISTQIYRVTEWEESSYYPAHFLHRSIRANILGNCWTRRHTKYLNIQIANKTTRKVEGN